MSKRLQTLAVAVALVTTVAIGYAATNLFQRTVPIVPGVQGCWRLNGSTRQVGCLAAEFGHGASKSAAGTEGRRHDDAVIAYVRRVDRLAANDVRLGNTCHPAMHDLGRREGGRAAVEHRVPTFPGGASQLCTAGYAHGLAEGYLSATPSSDVARVFPKLCHDPRSVAGCAHGVGHALLRGRGSASAQSAVIPTLTRCDELPTATRSDCHAGVFMELAMQTEPKPVPTREFMKACDGTGDTDKQLACWGYLPLSFTSNDIPTADVPSWCAKAFLPAQYPCMEGYGRAVGVRGVGKCQSAASTVGLRERCVDGAIGLQVGSGHVSAKAATNACRRLSTLALQKYCTRAVTRYERGRRSVEATDHEQG